MIYDLTLMFLALWKTAKLWKENIGAVGLDLVKVLVRDQAIYFIVCVSICIQLSFSSRPVLHRLLFIGIFQAVSNAFNINTDLFLASNILGNPNMLSIPGSRLLLNMRQAGERGLNAGTSCPTSTLSRIDFIEPEGESQSYDG